MYLLILALCLAPVVLLVVQIVLLIRINDLTRTMDPHLREEQRGLTEARGKSNTIIYRAIKNAQRLLVEGDLKGIALLAKQKLTGRQMSEAFEKHLQNSEESLQKAFDQALHTAEASYTQFLTDLETRLAQEGAANQAQMSLMTKHLIDESNSEMTSFVASLKKTVDTQMKEALASVQSDVDAYKARRLAIVDQHIYELVAQVVADTTGKVLTKQDHRDLILASLEKAKREGIFGKTEAAEK